LTILPQNSFGDAVSQFVNKDDKHAMEAFVNESLASQLKHLLSGESVEDEDMTEAMEGYKAKLEEMWAQGTLKRTVRKDKLKPKPANWDSDLDGEWAAQPGALVRSEDEALDEEEAAQPKPKATRGRGGKAIGTTRKSAAATKKAAPAKKTTTRTRKAPIEEESEDEEEDDVIMLDDDDEDEIPDVNDDDDDEDDLFVKQAPKKRAPAKTASKSTSKRAASPPKRKAPARSTAAKATGARQTTLNFSQTPAPSQTRTTATRAGRRTAGPSEDEISDDDDDAFEPPPTASRPVARRKF
ncbi:hypothetical protein KCU80_g18206, partial [Aureobasidium melanogenum]